MGLLDCCKDRRDRAREEEEATRELLELMWCPPQPVERVRVLVTEHPRAARGKDASENHPIHTACSNRASLQVIQLLVEAWPKVRAGSIRMWGSAHVSWMLSFSRLALLFLSVAACCFVGDCYFHSLALFHYHYTPTHFTRAWIRSPVTSKHPSTWLVCVRRPWKLFNFWPIIRPAPWSCPTSATNDPFTWPVAPTPMST